MIRKIISGGQTGADQGGLQAGLYLGLETGGTSAKGFMTEDGPAVMWLKKFGLVDLGLNYRERTKRNIVDADATVVFGRLDSAGSRLTVGEARRQGKPLITNPNSKELAEFIKAYEVETLNVAGNRESVRPGIARQVMVVVSMALRPTSLKVVKVKA